MVISVKKTMHTRFLALVLSAVLLLPALAGCSKKTGAEKDLAYPIDGEPVCLDPQIAADETAKLVTGNCFEGLVRLDESGAIVPGAAQRWDVSADGRTYTFHLREGMKWHIADSDELEELLGKGKNDRHHAECGGFCVRPKAGVVTGNGHGLRQSALCD